MKQASKIMLWRAIGVSVVAASTAAAVLYPQLAPANALFAWLVGKLLGMPLDTVVESSIAAMSPARAVEITLHAAENMPPSVRVEFMRSLRPPPPDVSLPDASAVKFDGTA